MEQLKQIKVFIHSIWKDLKESTTYPGREDSNEHTSVGHASLVFLLYGHILV